MDNRAQSDLKELRKLALLSLYENKCDMSTSSKPSEMESNVNNSIINRNINRIEILEERNKMEIDNNDAELDALIREKSEKAEAAVVKHRKSRSKINERVTQTVSQELAAPLLIEERVDLESLLPDIVMYPLQGRGEFHLQSWARKCVKCTDWLCCLMFVLL